MKQKFFLRTTAIAILLSFTFQSLIYAREYNFGALIDDTKPSTLPVASPDAAPSMPSNIANVSPVSVMLNTPPIGDQDFQSSCCAWAVGYAACGILSYDKYGRDWNVARRSPSYIYNQLSKSSDCSTLLSFDDVIAFINKHGVCSYKSMPYNMSSCTTQPDATQHQEASYNKFVGFGVSDDDLGNNIKSFIQKGIPVVFNFRVSDEYQSAAESSDGVIRSYKVDDSDRFNHACCFVGYDDSKRMFKVQDSYGIDNGDNGFLWVSYDAIPNMVRQAYVLFPINDLNFEFEIEGPDLLCSTETYSIKNCPSTASVTWSVPYSATGSGSAMPSFTTTTQGSEITITRKKTNIMGSNGTLIVQQYTGDLNITAKIVLNGKTYHLDKDLFVGTDVSPKMTMNGKPILLNGLNLFQAGHNITIDCDNVPAAKLRWELSIPGVGSRTYTNVSSVTAKPTEKGKMIVKVINTSGCPDDNYSSVSLNIDKRDVIIIPTNPIYSGTSIQAKVYSLIPDEQNTMSTMSASSNTENSIRIPYDGDFVVEIWSDAYGRVASYDGFGADISIPSTGLTKGIYYIKLIIDGVQADVASIVVN